MDNNVTAEKIKALLENQGMTQKELAEKANVTQAAVSHYIKGDRAPRGAILLNIANTLNVSTDYLLSIEDSDNDCSDEIESSYRLLARNSNKLTFEQKQRFLKLLLSEEK